MIRPNMRCKLILDVFSASIFIARLCPLRSLLLFRSSLCTTADVGGGAALVLCGIVCSCRP